ncbi:MAG TPA: hypothetical protein VLH15_05120, partial [Dehalococcoidales bacterium]|nr:hypothetical protein [Dehalococcoidales bacterium]
MSKLVESIVSVICALPLEEKRVAIIQLLSDQEFRVAISNLLLEKIGGTSYNTPNSTTHITVDKTNNHREIDKNGGTKQDNPQSLPNIADERRNSRREMGIEQREKYISQMKNKGIPINYIGNIWAKTNKNTWVAIPYASERQPNRWFLGIGETDIS